MKSDPALAAFTATPHSPAARTRRGKIARLPQVIRQRLNERLAEGEPYHLLVAWLNEHAEVRDRLDRYFEGRPITEQNLSEWRAGGFRDWERHQETRNTMRDFLCEMEELGAELGEEELLEKASVMVTFQLLRLFQEACRAEPGPEQRQAVLQIARELSRMRRVDHEAQRVRLLRQRERELAEQSDEPQHWRDIQRRIFADHEQQKKDDAWLKEEAAALRAEYVAGMKLGALYPGRREYIEDFFARFESELPYVDVQDLPRWRNPAGTPRRKRTTSPRRARSTPARRPAKAQAGAEVPAQARAAEGPEHDPNATHPPTDPSPLPATTTAPTHPAPRAAHPDLVAVNRT